MPKRTSPTDSAATVTAERADTLTPAEQLLARADALFRTAAEACRQHRRYACLVAHGVIEGEQRAALKLAGFCDTMLVEAIHGFEKCSAKVDGAGAEEWRHRANALWMAARDYERRHQVSDRAS